MDDFTFRECLHGGLFPGARIARGNTFLSVEKRRRKEPPDPQVREAAEKTARNMKAGRKRLWHQQAVAENSPMSAFNDPQDEIDVQWSQSLYAPRFADFFQEYLKKVVK